MVFADAGKLELPEMRLIRQRFVIPEPIDAIDHVEREWERIRNEIQLPRGGRIAIGVGSRGIANLTTVVRAVVDLLRDAGCTPFVTPAMGSHGGATAEGQIEVLKLRGITQDTVGAPIHATMDVVSIGAVKGIPLFIDRLAWEADGIVLVNRVKPHTNFIGATESGLIKMIAIGLGNQKGAEHYHRLSMIRDQYEIISTAGKALLKRCHVLFGVGLVENQEHQTCMLRIAGAGEMEAMEKELLEKARSLLPLLPVNDIDLLIVDEMGKDISGEGIDPNVVGRDVCAYGADRPLPRVTRILVRDLTPGSEGSALGIGQADFTTQRLVDKMDFQVTAINCLTSCCPEVGKIPLTYPNDREAIAAALVTLRPFTLEDVRIVHIKNTLELSHLAVSKGCLPDLHGKDEVEIGDDILGFAFGADGNLHSPWAEGRK